MGFICFQGLYAVVFGTKFLGSYIWAYRGLTEKEIVLRMSEENSYSKNALSFAAEPGTGLKLYNVMLKFLGQCHFSPASKAPSSQPELSYPDSKKPSVLSEESRYCKLDGGGAAGQTMGIVCKWSAARLWWRWQRRARHEDLIKAAVIICNCWARPRLVQYGSVTSSLLCCTRAVIIFASRSSCAGVVARVV